MSTTRAELLRLRSGAEGDVADLAVSLAEVRAARSDGTADDEHDPEGSTLTSDWSRLHGLNSTAAHRLTEIEGALARVDAATYAICTRCHSPIGEARLEARPATEFCIECARITEHR